MTGNVLSQCIFITHQESCESKAWARTAEVAGKEGKWSNGAGCFASQAASINSTEGPELTEARVAAPLGAQRCLALSHLPNAPQLAASTTRRDVSKSGRPANQQASLALVPV